jgi:hypothetical protein
MERGEGSFGFWRKRSLASWLMELGKTRSLTAKLIGRGAGSQPMGWKIP